jgi:hypothetical protein
VPDAESIEAEITVTHCRDLGAFRRVELVGEVSEETLESDPPRLKDLVRIRVTLSRPAYCYLIALNPDGTDQLCLSAGGPTPDTPRRKLDFPEGKRDFFSLTDGVGVQAFVLVASDRPLPAYEVWKSQVPGGLAWSPPDGDALWTYDVPPTSDPAWSRRDIVQRGVAPEALVALCGRLRKSPGVSVVRAVAFPVKPDQEIEK